MPAYKSDISDTFPFFCLPWQNIHNILKIYVKYIFRYFSSLLNNVILSKHIKSFENEIKNIFLINKKVIFYSLNVFYFSISHHSFEHPLKLKRECWNITNKLCNFILVYTYAFIHVWLLYPFFENLLGFLGNILKYFDKFNLVFLNELWSVDKVNYCLLINLSLWNTLGIMF